jgi:hypothetical protein
LYIFASGYPLLCHPHRFSLPFYFNPQMALIPVIVGLLAVAYLLAMCRVKKDTKFTKESAKSTLFKLTSLL